MKFLLYGGKGFIGQHFYNYLVTVGEHVVYGKRVNILEDVLDDLREHQPDRVIACVGRTYGPSHANADYLELPGMLSENIQCNLAAPVLIAQGTSGFCGNAVPLLYVGTGCLFRYDFRHPFGSTFAEEDTPNFYGSSYSIVKGHTEQLLQGFEHVLSARLRQPVTNHEEKRDLVTKLTGYKRIASVPNSITILTDIIPFLVGCLVKKKCGIINGVNPGLITNLRILEIYQDINKMRLSYEVVTQEELEKSLLSQRCNTCLDTKKAEAWLQQLSPITKKRYRIPEKLDDAERRVIDILTERGKRKALTDALRCAKGKDEPQLLSVL